MPDNIMRYETTLPSNFTGVFYFTNPSDREFVGTWNNKQYHFPPQSTSPMVMPEHSPLEIQHIRKKFARDLAEREFYTSNRYEEMRVQEGVKVAGMLTPRLSGIHQAVAYTIDDLTPYIQSCLNPLEEKRASVTEAPRINTEARLSRNEEGELNSVAVDKRLSLKDRAVSGTGLPTDSATLNAPPTRD